MGKPTLVTIELRFQTSDDPAQLTERVREAVRMVVGREALEDFRVRTIPMGGPEKPHAV